MSSIFACDLGLNRNPLSRNFFCCFVFRFREIFFNQHWRQMRASLILLFGKTKAFFGKDTARKKLRFCIRYLWKMKEKPANLNRGLCFSIKWKATCRNWAHLDKEKNFGLKSHLRACCTQPFNYSIQTDGRFLITNKEKKSFGRKCYIYVSGLLNRYSLKWSVGCPGLKETHDFFSCWRKDCLILIIQCNYMC